MKVQYKATVWMEIEVYSKSAIPDIINILKRSENIHDLYDEGLNISGTNYIYGTEEFIPPYENDNNETIVVYGENGQKVWDNSIQSQVKELEDDN